MYWVWNSGVSVSYSIQSLVSSEKVENHNLPRVVDDHSILVHYRYPTDSLLSHDVKCLESLAVESDRNDRLRHDGAANRRELQKIGRRRDCQLRKPQKNRSFTTKARPLAHSILRRFVMLRLLECRRRMWGMKKGRGLRGRHLLECRENNFEEHSLSHHLAQPPLLCIAPRYPYDVASRLGKAERRAERRKFRQATGWR